MFGWSRASPFPAQQLPEAPPPLPQGVLVPVGPYKGTNTQYQWDTQGQHVQMSYLCCLASANGAGYHSAATATDLEHHEYPPTLMNGLGSVLGTVDWSMNPPNPAPAVDQVGPWAIDPSSGCDMAPCSEETSAEGRPAKYDTRFSVPYTRRTRTGRRAPTSGPPQTFEDVPEVLAARLITEGADSDAVDLVRRVIFVDEVTERALSAPIKSRDLSLKYGGVRRKWQLLLQVTEIAPGAKSYCCRLCPQQRRPEYKNAVDGLRHLKRDHFGFSVACQYW